MSLVYNKHKLISLGIPVLSEGNILYYRDEEEDAVTESGADENVTEWQKDIILAKCIFP